MPNVNFHKILKEIGDLQDKKNLDYGREEDPYANVRGSVDWGVKPWQGAMIRANDKVKRLQKYAKTGELANEGVEDSFKDLAVYALIALDLWRQEKTQELIDSEGIHPVVKQATMNDMEMAVSDPGDETRRSWGT